MVGEAERLHGAKEGFAGSGKSNGLARAAPGDGGREQNLRAETAEVADLRYVERDVALAGLEKAIPQRSGGSRPQHLVKNDHDRI